MLEAVVATMFGTFREVWAFLNVEKHIAMIVGYSWQEMKRIPSTGVSRNVALFQ